MTSQTGTLIYVGRLTKIDTDESNLTNENGAAIIGHYTTGLRTMQVEQHSADGDHIMQADDLGNTPDLLTYELDGVQTSTTLDAVATYNFYHTDVNGSWIHTIGNVYQGENGDTFVEMSAGVELQTLYIHSLIDDAVGGMNIGRSSTARVICFCAGTLIETPCGAVPVEMLRPGDLVMTADNGPQPVLWHSTRSIPCDKKQAPVRIAKGALGLGLPERDLCVSPQHRVMVRSAIAKRMTGHDEVLLPAKKLVGLPGIAAEPAPCVATYVHFLLSSHHIVYAQGAPCESLHPGPEARRVMSLTDDNECDEVLNACLLDMSQVPARPMLDGSKAKSLINRHERNGKPLLEVETSMRRKSNAQKEKPLAPALSRFWLHLQEPRGSC